MSVEGVWKVIEIQSKFNLGSTLTWDFTIIKMKTFTWNSSVALLNPTCVCYNWLSGFSFVGLIDKIWFHMICSLHFKILLRRCNFVDFVW